MANDDTYQGWTNRETWAASLHLSNDEGLYNDSRDTVRNALVGGPYSRGNALEDWVTAVVENNRESGYTDDTITMMDREVGSWWRVNWREVADGLTED